MQAPAFLDLAHRAEFSAVGRHMQVRRLGPGAQARGGRLWRAPAHLLPQVVTTLGVGDERQVLQLLDAFIERGPLKRKVENRA